MTEDLILRGRVLTMDDRQPRASAIAVSRGKIVAVGDIEVARTALPDARTVHLDTACIMPGFIEAHGHPTAAATTLAETFVDIRPVIIGDASTVLDTIRREVADRGTEGAYFNGWDPLLQKGLPPIDRRVLDEIAPSTPLVIVHNSGHAVYFNSAAAEAAGVTRETPDPPGASWGHDDDGELSGVGHETGTLLVILAPVLRTLGPITERLRQYCGQLNAAGITTVSDMAFNPQDRDALNTAQAAGALTTRLRLYEMSSPALHSDTTLDNGDDMLRQIGIKTWSDGSPWVGNIATSFPYLDTPATQAMGLPPGHRGTTNYTREQLDEINEAYFLLGWQLSCHSHGDDAIDMVLGSWEDLLRHHPRDDHRLRLEHCGAMRPDQFARAAQIGVTCSLFVDHLYYWGDVLVDDLFGPDHGARWAAAGSAVRAGVRISMHNDAPVTPDEPLRNISVGVTRTSRNGSVLASDERLTVDQALRAETIDAAYQLFADDIVGSLTPGKYADIVVLSGDPTETAPEQIPDLTVLATFLAGEQVHGTEL